MGDRYVCLRTERLAWAAASHAGAPDLPQQMQAVSAQPCRAVLTASQHGHLQLPPDVNAARSHAELSSAGRAVQALHRRRIQLHSAAAPERI